MMEMERFAELLAHVRHFGFEHLGEVCERLSIDATDWEAAQRHWTAALAENAKTDEAALVMAFGKRQSEVEAELAERQPKLEDLGPESTEDPMADTVAGVEPDDRGEASLPSSPEVPSFTETPPAIVEPRHVHTPTPAPAVGTAPSPWADHPRTPEVAPARSPASASAIDVTAPAAPAIGEALPFEGKVAAPPPVSAKAHPAAGATVEAKAPLTDEPDVDGTAMITELNLEDPLPFADGDVAPPSTSVLDEPNPDAGATAFVSALTDDDLATPFEAASTTLSVEQYASLQAELTVYPLQHETVLQRYRLDRASLIKLDTSFAKRFAASPADKARYDSLRVRYAEWLRTRG